MLFKRYRHIIIHLEKKMIWKMYLSTDVGINKKQASNLVYSYVNLFVFEWDDYVLIFVTVGTTEI